MRSFLSVLFVFGLISAGFSQQTSGPWTYTVSGGLATITRLSGYYWGDTLIIPSWIDGYPVRTLGDGSASIFKGSTYEYYPRPNVVISEGIANIAARAFQFARVTNFVFPSSVSNVGESAFYGCSLTEAMFPRGLVSLGAFAFSGCESLVSATIPDSVTSLGDFVFSNCQNLSAINVDADNSVYASIDGVLFNKAGTTLLEFPTGKQGAYSIPLGVTTVAMQAFMQKPALSSVTIPKTVTNIVPTYTTPFDFCSNLTDINVDPDNSVYASVNGVLFNKALSELLEYPDGRKGSYTVPSSTLKIGDSAFYGASGLTAVTLPNGLTSIGRQSFASSGITNLVTPSSVTSIGDWAFAFCSSLTNAPIGNGVQSIGSRAFYFCENIREAVIPSSVNSIGDAAFAWSSKLTNIAVDTANAIFASKDGVLFNKTFVNILQHPAGKTGFYVIPDGVITIGPSAFEGSALLAVSIPTSVTTIGSGAFWAAGKLVTLTIPSAVATMGADAFLGCSSLSSVLFLGNPPTFPSWNNLFNSCPETLKIYRLDTASGWGSTFSGRATVVSPYGVHFLQGAASAAPFDTSEVANWSRSGSEWLFDAGVNHDGRDSARAVANDEQETFREYRVEGPVVVDFWWKVSSERDYDIFSFSIDGSQVEAISGESDWMYRTFTLPEGAHTIRWTYSKDSSGAVGADAGWLDDFAIYPAISTLRVKDGATILTGSAEVNFGSGGGQNALTKTLTLENAGYLPLAVELSLPSNSPFTFADGTRLSELFLERQSSTQITVVLPVSSSGQKSTFMTISAPDSTAPPPSLNLTGKVLGGDIRVAYQGSQLVSGQANTVSMGLAPHEAEFTITNNGNAADLVISQVVATGNFQVSQQPAVSVAVGASTTIKVLATDLQQGAQQGIISISSNDEDTPVFTIPVSSKALLGVGAGVSAGSVSTSGFGWPSVGWDFATTSLPNGNTGSALKTGATANSGQSQLQATIVEAGLLSWKWKVATQEGFDWLACEVNGSEVLAVSTKNAVWRQQVLHVPSNAVVKWVYRKDASGTIGEDAGYLADISFEPFRSPPITYSNWWASFGRPVAPPATSLMPRSSLPAVMSWVSGFNPDTVPDFGHYRQLIEGGQPKFRFPISKRYSGGSVSAEFSSGLTNGWSGAGVTQILHSQDADRVIIEATPPAGATKGFMRLNVR